MPSDPHELDGLAGEPSSTDLGDELEERGERSPSIVRLESIVSTGRTPEGEEVGWEVRIRALDELERIQDLRAEPPVDLTEGRLEEMEERWESPPRRELGSTFRPQGEGAPRPRGRRAAPAAAVRVTDVSGDTSWRELGNDVAATRAFLEREADSAGITLAELAGPFQPGRPSAREAERRAALALLVDAARRRKATLAAIAEALQLDKRRVSEIARRERGET
jgi:hypothetical protein